MKTCYYKTVKKIFFLFPSNWSLIVGNPHLAIPLLKSHVANKGYELEAYDLNLGFAKFCGFNFDISYVQPFSLALLNEPYFSVEDSLASIANIFGGNWNLQLGFNSLKYSSASSQQVLEASRTDLPFTSYYKNNVLPLINKEKPDIVAISVASASQLIPTFHLCWLLRHSGFDGKIVVGGNVISRLKNEIKIDALFDLVDVFVFFQGEIPFALLCDAFLQNKALHPVPNIIFRDNNRRIIETKNVTLRNPDMFPTPDFEGLPIGKYFGINYLPLIASRGCYHSECTFCSIPFGWGEGGYGGMRSPKLTYTDMSALKKKHRVHRFKFMDESLNPSFMTALSKIILQSNGHYEWEGYARLEKVWLSHNFTNLISKAGFKKAYFGLEIYPNSSRNTLNKNDCGISILDILRNCSYSGIKVHLFCMFGFPGTGRKEAEETLKFILDNVGLIDTVDVNGFSYSKHTFIPSLKKIDHPLKDWALEYDYVPLEKDILAPDEIKGLVYELEEVIWQQHPKLLHPTYRLLSPWDDAMKYMMQENIEEEFSFANTV